MRILKLLGVSLLTLGLAISACAEDDSKDHSKTDQSKMEMTDKSEGIGTGVINAVSADKKSINITHEPMPKLVWPQMTMDLPTTEKVNLSRIKAGDKVTFKIKPGRDKKYRVIEMKPAQWECGLLAGCRARGFDL